MLKKVDSQSVIMARNFIGTISYMTKAWILLAILLNVVLCNHSDNTITFRCRKCGAIAALKKNYINLPDNKKAIKSNRESLLGEHGKIETFYDPNYIEMEMAYFGNSLGVEESKHTKHASVFSNYNWRNLRCPICNRHIGWHFRHDEVQKCLDEFKDTLQTNEEESDLSTLTNNELTNDNIVRNAFGDKCITATAGWWTYQVCYAKEVRQYHEDADGTRTSEWSMGKYVENADTSINLATQSEDKNVNEQDERIVIQNFTGGRHCDENNEQRKTQVIYTCCKIKPEILRLNTVDEPELCVYEINVCIPGLCTRVSKETQRQEQIKYAKKCEEDYIRKHSELSNEMPPSFAALSWPTIISDESSELDWVKSMKFSS